MLYRYANHERRKREYDWNNFTYIARAKSNPTIKYNYSREFRIDKERLLENQQFQLHYLSYLNRDERRKNEGVRNERNRRDNFTYIGSSVSSRRIERVIRCLELEIDKM